MNEPTLQLMKKLMNRFYVSVKLGMIKVKKLLIVKMIMWSNGYKIMNEKKEQASFLEFVEFAVILPKEELKNIVGRCNQANKIEKLDFASYSFHFRYLRTAYCSKGICIRFKTVFYLYYKYENILILHCKHYTVGCKEN
ncbi:hypothetical protein RFI_34412 [Reticulomyxa filosa]|uniref:Uncharacterized protein n=1 Tax=Reticulomyxa filosa TaxID=46433 RepID=X6LN25_RETFI|nr:hypothetical protein RFI_34412 [Reticulomyxa filosa]|eukprot:ETO02999.1 hypothetical protein RFI_34412 [Reticulomyxa filosa]